MVCFTMDIKERFGKRIKFLREQLNISQEQLAEIAGLHRTYVSSVERGERNISLENIVKLAQSLKCKPDELLKDI